MSVKAAFAGQHRTQDGWMILVRLATDELEPPLPEFRIFVSDARVFDPEEADLFYIPFFSSLSLVANPIRANGDGSPQEKVYSDEEMQESLIEWLEG